MRCIWSEKREEMGWDEALETLLLRKLGNGRGMNKGDGEKSQWDQKKPGECGVLQAKWENFFKEEGLINYFK